MPKSSVHALFGWKKEELQLATVNAAREALSAKSLALR